MQNFDEGYKRNVRIGSEEVEYEVNRKALAALGKEERSFIIGGETFVRAIAVAPEVVAPYYAHIIGEVMWPELEVAANYDTLILAMLEPGQEEKWHKVRSPQAKHPLMFNDLDALVTWLLAEMSGRPTELPSGSSRGSGGTAAKTTSSPASGSPEEQA